MFCTFTLVFCEVCVKCQIWLLYAVTWFCPFPLCCWGIFWMILRWFQLPLLLVSFCFYILLALYFCCKVFVFKNFLWFFLDHISHYYHYHLPPWISSFDLFRHWRIAIVSWGIHDLFFLEVCSWGRVSGVWCCPFFQDGWSNFVCIWVSRLVFQRCLVLFLWLRFLFCPILCIP